MSIPIDFLSVMARCKKVLAKSGKTLTAITTVSGFAPVVWEHQLKEGGRTRAIKNFEQYARDLDCLSPEECKNGEWASLHERAA
jgi:hypothetical protein